MTRTFLAISCGMMLALASAARAQAPDVVYLRDGTRLRGLLSDYRPSSGGTLLINGEARVLGADQIDHVTHLDDEVAPPSVPIHFIATDSGPLTLYHVVGESTRAPPAVADHDAYWSAMRSLSSHGRQYSSGTFRVAERLCTAPCDAMLPLGPSELALALGASPPVLLPSITLDRPMTLAGSYGSQGTMRDAGLVTLFTAVYLGAAAAGGSAVALLLAPNETDLTTGLFFAAAGTLVVGIVVGLLLYLLGTDSPRVTAL